MWSADARGFEALRVLSQKLARQAKSRPPSSDTSHMAFLEKNSTASRPGASTRHGAEPDPSLVGSDPGQRPALQLVDLTAVRLPLGEVLVRDGAITERQLAHALAEQQKKHVPLGELLVRLGFVTDAKMRQALGRQLRISYIDLDRLKVDRALTRIVNSSYAKRHALVPVSRTGDTLTVCMDDPTNRTVIEELSRSTGLVLTPVTAAREAINRAFRRLYDEKPKPAPEVEGVGVVVEDGLDPTLESKYAEEGRVKKADVIVRQLLSVAIARRASDIHLETLASSAQIRFRIDGVLESIDLGDLKDACTTNSREIVSRIKILAKLDIAERRRPQDGGFRVQLERDNQLTGVDIRVSIVPSYYGESAVLRILDRSHAPTSIDQLGLPSTVIDKWRRLIHRPSGILLVTGPTGSGKSTTLYASLMTVYRPQIRVLTAEDTIEYVYEQFSQSEVNADIGNTFATYLRAFLRHDPEVIMVGEIRDEETAEMAFRAAQTGHLLLSTLHTETAIAAVPRLLDMKIDPNTIASALNGVMGQRLVRRVCRTCATKHDPPADMVREFFAQPPAMVFKKGAGCKDCNHSGYRGRVTIAELWVPSDDDVLLITKNAPFDEIRENAKRSTVPMSESMLAALNEGLTNLEELVRVMPYSSIVDFRQRQTPSLAAATA
jgi:type IV pilus assembly protein PilB